MPYIKEHIRHQIPERGVENPGELNFIITALCDDYLEKRGLSYDTINSIIGAIECAKMELYRRIAAPYEDIKIKENGDAYLWAKDAVCNYSSTA